MSEHCLHATESAWTGPTSKDVLAAARRSAVRICFTHKVTGEEILVTVEYASESLIEPKSIFSGRCDDGRRIEDGVLCSANHHPGITHIEFELVPNLALVADAG